MTTSTPTQPAKRPWTILVWIAGDNNLSDAGDTDLHELKLVGSGPKVNLVAQYDRAGRRGTQRYFLRKGTTLDADAVADLGETNCGDPAVATDFFIWGIQTYPSDRVMCVLWNHGSGIDENDVYARARALPSPAGTRGGGAPVDRNHVRAIAASRLSRALFSTTIDAAVLDRGIGYDDASRDFLDNAELSNVLSKVRAAAGRKIDVVGFDACLMNMVEIGYQLRDHADFIVGSEEVEPGNGWPYDKVAAAATKAATGSPAKLATAVVASYLAAYANDPHEDRVTQSAVDLAKAAPLAQAVDALAGACIASLADAAAYKAFSQSVHRSLRFEVNDFVDLGDLCAQLAALSPDAAVKAAAQAVSGALGGKGGYVVSSGSKGQAVAAASGAAIWLPPAKIGDSKVAYDKLDFARDTRWGQLVKAFHEA